MKTDLGTLDLRQASGDWSTWDDFVDRFSSDPFWQSSTWAGFMEAYGHQVFQARLLQGGRTLLQALILQAEYPLGIRMWFIHRGPVLRAVVEPTKVLESFVSRVGARAREARVVGISLCPPCQPGMFDADSVGLTRSAIDLDEPNSYFVDLDMSATELLARCSARNRYNIRLARRKGVVTIRSAERRPMEILGRFVEDMGRRKRIHTLPASFFGQLADYFQNGHRWGVLTSSFEGEPIACISCCLWREHAILLGSGFSYEHRALKGPNLALWEALLYAQSEGCSTFRLGGVSPTDSQSHPLSRLSHFKRAFPGHTRHHESTLDHIIDPIRYKILMALRKELRVRSRRGGDGISTPE